MENKLKCKEQMLHGSWP